jgi:flagellar biosynthesis/type III secretory pathway protein FliH
MKMANQNNPNKKAEEKKDAAGEPKPRRIMVQPLPQILDDIENSIALADEAAKNAREAAEEARKAGEKAAREAARVAAEAISRVEQTAKSALQLAELLNATLIEVAAAIEKKLTGKR